MKIKVGRKEWKVKVGDFIQFNGLVYQYHSDKPLRFEKWTNYSYVTLPMTMVKKIPLQNMRKVRLSANITRWYFDANE